LLNGGVNDVICIVLIALLGAFFVILIRVLEGRSRG